MARSSRRREDSRTLWREVRDATPFAANGPSATARLADSIAPCKGFEMGALIGPGAGVLRLGRRADLARAAGHRDAGAALSATPWPRSADTPRSYARPRRYGPRSTCSIRSTARRRTDQARQGELRSQGRAQSGPDVGGVLMQTNFSLAQLADPDIAEADKILRACVHCGFCTATCPTYVLLGDELDSPRGRIYLIKDMLEGDRPATTRGGQAHRPLPVLPGLHDDLPLGRALHASRRPCARHIEETYRRPLLDRLLRAVLAACCPIRCGCAPRCSRPRWPSRWRRCSRASA